MSIKRLEERVKHYAKLRRSAQGIEMIHYFGKLHAEAAKELKEEREKINKEPAKIGEILV